MSLLEDAEKRIDDSSYRAMFFRDEYLKKGLHMAKEKEGQNPPLIRSGRTNTQNNNSLICNDLHQSASGTGAETVANSEFPPDLRKVIDHWDTLPPEVKQTILTLVKHSRQRKRPLTRPTQSAK